MWAAHENDQLWDLEEDFVTISEVGGIFMGEGTTLSILSHTEQHYLSEYFFHEPCKRQVSK